jgi:hypothetical protein
MAAVNNFIARLVAASVREEGQAVTEYAVVLVLIAGISALLLATGTGVASTIVGKITGTLAGI